jgi:hypothetical protein
MNTIVRRDPIQRGELDGLLPEPWVEALNNHYREWGDSNRIKAFKLLEPSNGWHTAVLVQSDGRGWFLVGEPEYAEGWRWNHRGASFEFKTNSQRKVLRAHKKRLRWIRERTAEYANQSPTLLRSVAEFEQTGP